jgi:hypothetical protein
MVRVCTPILKSPNISGPSLLWPEFVIVRVCHGPSLLWSELSNYHPDLPHLRTEVDDNLCN